MREEHIPYFKNPKIPENPFAEDLLFLFNRLCMQFLFETLFELYFDYPIWFKFRHYFFKTSCSNVALPLKYSVTGLDICFSQICSSICWNIFFSGWNAATLRSRVFKGITGMYFPEMKRKDENNLFLIFFHRKMLWLFPVMGKACWCFLLSPNAYCAIPVYFCYHALSFICSQMFFESINRI